MPNVVDTVFPLPLLFKEKLYLCLVQTKAPCFDVVKAGGSRPEMIETARSLLTGSLRRFVPPVAPLVVVMPEYAFAPSDWEALDTIVKQAIRTVVLIAGFGPVTGQELCAWVETAEETTRKFAFDRDELADGARYGGGWCWVREASGSITCVAYAKNWRQQREELDLIDGTVNSIAALSFNDVTLFPLLCSDLIAETDERARQAVIDVVKVLEHPALVIGSLWQEEPSSGLWQRALDRWAYELPERVVIALVNHAMDQPKRDEEFDRWRSLSGLFGKRADSASLASCTAMRVGPLLADSAGMVLRRTVPCAVLGEVGWPPFRADLGRRLWTSGKCFSIGEDGAVEGTEVQSPQSYELARFLRRHRPAKCDPLLGKGINLIAEDLLAGRSLQAELLHSTMLHGIDRGRADYDGLHEIPNMEEPLLGLAYLFASGELGWPERDSNLVGQAEFLDSSANVLVWRASVTSTALKRKLQTWLNENAGHRKLLVINKSTYNALDDPLVPELALNSPVKADRHTDISASPPSKDQLSIDSARTVGRVECVPLGRVCETFLDEGESRLAELMTQLKERLR